MHGLHDSLSFRGEVRQTDRGHPLPDRASSFAALLGTNLPAADLCVFPASPASQGVAVALLAVPGLGNAAAAGALRLAQDFPPCGSLAGRFTSARLFALAVFEIGGARFGARRTSSPRRNFAGLRAAGPVFKGQ